MYNFFIIFTALTCLFSVLAAPLPSDHSLDKRNAGRGTWFVDGQDACGEWDTNSELIVAVSQAIYGGGQYCNRYVSITANNVQVYAVVHDECQGCGANDLDMSEGLFQKFAALSVGVVTIDWNFMPVGWTK